MPKKLTFEQVKNYIEATGYHLLDNIYINDHTKLSLKCPKEHNFLIVLNSFKNGRRCSVCKGIETTKRQRTPYEVILKKVNELNRKLLTSKEEYEAIYSKENRYFLIECLCGSPHKTTLDRLRKKCLCKLCSNKKTGDRCRTPIEKIKTLLEKKNLTLLSKDYENETLQVEVLCEKNHKFLVRLPEIKSEYKGCPLCKSDSASTRSRIPYNTLIEIAAVNNMLILMPENIYSQNFFGNKKKIPVKCTICSYEFTTDPGRIGSGRSCKVCGFKKSADKRRTTYEEVKNIVEKAGYILITPTYEHHHQELIVSCRKHGIFKTFFNYLTNGHGCGKCSHIYPKSQQELFDYVKTFYPDAIDNTKQIINPLELDVYIPSIKLGIEYNGIYYHSEQYRDKNSHFKKMKLCNEKDIRLITIFEDEWLKRKDQVKNFLLSAMNKNETRIMGRKTDLRIVPKKEASDFLKLNHVQGSTVFEIAFGLYYNDELQAVVTGNKHHRQGHTQLFVLNRLAFKSNVSISGGSSKLLKALLDYAKINGYSELISWSDNRWSEGNVYQKLGFQLIEELPPDYSYVKKDYRISKQSCKKKNLLQKGAKGDMSMTERELALTLNLWRIWDCGKKRWSISL